MKFGKEFKSNFINIYLNQTNDKVFNNLVNDIKIFIFKKVQTLLSKKYY